MGNGGEGQTRTCKTASNMVGKIEKWDKVEGIMNDLSENVFQRKEFKEVMELKKSQDVLR